MTVFLTKNVTVFRTRYKTNFLGIISKFYTTYPSVTDDGKTVMITDIVSVVTVPFGRQKPYMTFKTESLVKALKRVALV